MNTPHLGGSKSQVQYPHLSNMAKPPFAAQITLEYTLQQDANKGVEDVRSGMSNAAERRKEQNRVHQKAWRKYLFHFFTISPRMSQWSTDDVCVFNLQG